MASRKGKLRGIHSKGILDKAWFSRIFHKNLSYLTAVFFETGAMLTPTKSQNGPIVVQGVRFNHT